MIRKLNIRFSSSVSTFPSPRQWRQRIVIYLYTARLCLVSLVSKSVRAFFSFFSFLWKSKKHDLSRFLNTECWREKTESNGSWSWRQVGAFLTERSRIRMPRLMAYLTIHLSSRSSPNICQSWHFPPSPQNALFQACILHTYTIAACWSAQMMGLHLLQSPHDR